MPDMRKWIIAGSVVVALLLVGSCTYGTMVSIKNDGVSMEQNLSANYENNQNYLSTFVSTFYETTRLANLKSEKMDSILVHAVRGRYGENGFSSQGAFFSAVSEQYPNLDLTVYDKIITQVQSGREEFRNRQSALLDQLRSYETWKRQGFIRPVFISFLGFPTTELKARVGGATVASGPEALEKFHQLVITETTAAAFQTGRQEPLTPPKN